MSNGSAQTIRMFGRLKPVQHGPLPFGLVIPARPHLRAGVRVGDYVRNLEFMLDTGADATTLQTSDAHELMGDDLFLIDFERDPGLVGVAGVTAGSSASVIRPAVYSIRTDQGGHHIVNAHIVIAQPVPFELSNTGNWRKISTLGRDIMSHFGFRLDYRASEPVLLEVDS